MESTSTAGGPESESPPADGRESEAVKVPEPAIPWRAWAERSTAALPWLARGSRWLVAAAAVYYVLLYVWIAGNRASYPFDLEWMEGAVIDHARFVAENGHPFVEPSLEFAPFIYNPLYYYAVAFFGTFLGIDFLAARLVSGLAWLLTLGLTFQLVRKETASPLAGLVSAGLLAATYALTDGWPDLARVDSLLLLLMMAATYGVRFAQSRRGLVLAGLCLFLAFAAKQVALGLLPPLALYVLMFRDLRSAACFVAASVLPCALFVLGVNALSDGWYWYYAFEIPSTHRSVYDIKRWQEQLLGPLCVTLPFSFVYFTRRIGDSAQLERRLFHILVGGALVGIAVLARAHTGSWRNDNVTAYIAVCVFTGLGAAPLLRQAQSGQLNTTFACVLLLGQFWMLDYSPKRWLPTEKDHAEAEWLEERIQSFEGEVYLPHHGHIGYRAGKGSFAHDMALYDIKRAKKDFKGAQKKLARQTKDALREHRFEAIITDRESRAYVHPKLLKKYYEQTDKSYFDREKALVTRCGIHIRPRFLFEPKDR